jgi:hypothetical protein
MFHKLWGKIQMLSTRKAWSFLAVIALAGWLSAPTQAQESRHTVTDEVEDISETSELRADVNELRTRLNAQTSGDYEGGYGGCGAPAAAPGCGCQASCDDCRGTCGGFEPCCHSAGFWGELELMFFRYHRADGVRVGDFEPAEDVEFDFEITPRITFGWVRSDGLGARIRWWEFDHDALGSAPGAFQPQPALSVDTYNWDFEVFDTFALNCNWDLEIAGGIRYNEFEESGLNSENEVILNQFSGWGGVASAEMRRCVGTNGALFVRARASVLMDDKRVAWVNDDDGNDVLLRDVTVGTTELAFGYQYTMPICGGGYYFVKLQAEWQNWYNFSSGFEDTEDTEDFAGPADVGFGGFGASAGIAR